ncbi:hypothetical protein D3C80_1900210 [compost metagenome]
MEFGHPQRIAGFTDIAGNGAHRFFGYAGQHRQVKQGQGDPAAEYGQADAEIFGEDCQPEQPEYN